MSCLEGGLVEYLGHVAGWKLRGHLRKRFWLGDDNLSANSIIIGSGRGGRLSPFQSVVVIAWRWGVVEEVMNGVRRHNQVGRWVRDGGEGMDWAECVAVIAILLE